MKKLLKWLDENLEESMMLFLLGVISITMMLQIILRYIFKTPLPWIEELCRYCFVYSGAISAGYCVRHHLGIRVDLIIGSLPDIFKIILEYISKLLVIALYLFLATKSFDLISKTSTVSAAMQIPIKYIYMALPIGFYLGAFRGIQMLIIYTANLKKGEGK